MGGLAGIQAAINKGRGAAGIATGQRYSVYRLNNQSTGSLVQPSNLVIGNFPASMKRYSLHEDIETNYFIKVPTFRGLCDASQLQIGDVLVEQGFGSDGGAFTFAYNRQLRAFVFVQTPIPATLTRSEPNPLHVDKGRVPYSGMNKGTEQTLALINGNYSFKPSGVYPPAAVYLGLVALASRGEQPRPALKLPTDVPRQSWDVYCHLLPGTVLIESDIVNAANGDRYYIRTSYLQYVGLHGIMLSCEKLRV